LEKKTLKTTFIIAGRHAERYGGVAFEQTKQSQ